MLTDRAWLTALHGICFGGLALLTSFGLVVGLLTVFGVGGGRDRLSVQAAWVERCYLLVTSLTSWAAVISGTFLAYPWYRVAPPPGTTDLHAFPRALLLSAAATAPWHRVGMEWKEHVAWFAPITITAVTVVWWRFREELMGNRALRAAVIVFGAAGVGAAAVAAVLGAFLNKLAPVY